MTREEAIKCLAGLLDAFDSDEHGDYFYDHGWEVCEATILAHAALREQESAENAHCNSCKKCNSWIPVEERLPEPDTDVLARRSIGTIADQIRSMTDEELAKLSAYMMSRGDCWGCPWFWPCDYEKETCTKFFLDWLRKPYKEDT